MSAIRDEHLHDTGRCRTTLELTEPQKVALRLIAAKYDQSRQAIVSAAVDAVIGAEIQQDSVLALCVGKALGMPWDELEAARRDADAFTLALQ
jgi:hypothetical protein